MVLALYGLLPVPSLHLSSALWYALYIIYRAQPKYLPKIDIIQYTLR